MRTPRMWIVLAMLMWAPLTMGKQPVENDYSKFILTPPPPATPRINGPDVFGVRPHSVLLYTIPATGDRPMTFSADGLPAGATLDAKTGQITGRVDQAGTYHLTLHARNDKGEATRAFRLVVGDRIALTPPMGWNSWNCWAEAVDQQKVLQSARAMVKSGLINHGWSYINIDDTWQGQRTGAGHALEPNEKFPDMKGMCDEVHAMGLKAGIYSTPWITSYAKFAGGSSDSPDGAWSKQLADNKGWRFGEHGFEAADAKQWAAWGIDYLKYDWNPIDVPHVRAMHDALRATDRDIVFSLSNSASFAHAADWARWANCWRTTGDIRDCWRTPDGEWYWSISGIGFSRDAWAPYSGPGHFNDPDMLVVGYVGWGPHLHLSQLTPDEQYTHISMWCMLSAPLLLGCDLDRLDPFTLNLLKNDEVLAIDQDALGVQATRIATDGPIDVYVKPLEDGSHAIAFFNRADSTQSLVFNRLREFGLPSRGTLRDLWRQKDVETYHGKFSATIPAHGVMLYRLIAKH